MRTKLESLTQKDIKERELSPSDLWIIKMGEEIRGPFEYENLKLYIQENENLFQEALGSRLDPQDWRPLFNYPQFQRRSPQIVSAAPSIEGPFWLHENGLKVGPFEKFHILKRLEMNSLIVTDKISYDDGQTWINIYEIPEFDRRDLKNLELPVAPQVQTLAQIYGKDPVKEETSDVLASTAHRGLSKEKVIPFKSKELELPQNKNPFWSQLTFPDWMIPSGIALGVMIVGTTLFALMPNEEIQTPSVAQITSQSRPLVGEKRTVNPSAQLGRSRTPASIPSNTNEAPSTSSPVPRRLSLAKRHLQMNDNIPTTIESHHMDRYPSEETQDPNFGHYEEPYTDPHDNPFDGDAIVHEEVPPADNLVPDSRSSRPRTPASLGDVMGYEENVVDEASDF